MTASAPPTALSSTTMPTPPCRFLFQIRDLTQETGDLAFMMATRRGQKIPPESAVELVQYSPAKDNRWGTTEAR